MLFRILSINYKIQSSWNEFEHIDCHIIILDDLKEHVF